jgi:hypothetical protein
MAGETVRGMSGSRLIVMGEHGFPPCAAIARRTTA